MSVQKAAPAEKSQPEAQAEAGPPAVQEVDSGSAEETKSDDAVATEAPTATSQASERSRSPSWGPLPATMTSVQHELFQRLANDVPHDRKEPKDLTYDDSKGALSDPRQAAPTGYPRHGHRVDGKERIRRPFFVDDDELHAGKKKVGQMGNKRLCIKKIKITITQRKKIEEETIAANKRSEAEIEEQRQR
ncbi:hypothetical protein AC1031_009816 [Aphanomyces cochlioides]|nr:hypothetical protein AC1031_009816 [Aphanomyces cochlioides]